MTRIEIQQLDQHGQVWRTFVLHRWPWEVDEALERIDRAYNMINTRVIVSGESGHE